MDSREGKFLKITFSYLDAYLLFIYEYAIELFDI